MALTLCTECQHDLSNKSTLCPHCGAPTAKPFGIMSAIKWLFILTFGIMVYTCASVKESSQPAPATASTAKAPAPVDDGLQAKRETFIRQLIGDNIILKTEQREIGALPRAYINHAFHALPFEQKQRYMDTILTYYRTADPTATILVIKDPQTNQQIATFSEHGLEFD